METVSSWLPGRRGLPSRRGEGVRALRGPPAAQDGANVSTPDPGRRLLLPLLTKGPCASRRLLTKRSQSTNQHEVMFLLHSCSPACAVVSTC